MSEQSQVHVLRNAVVITQNAKREVLLHGAVVFQGNKILYVGSDAPDLLESFHGHTIDCAGSIVMPGLIDGHGHAGHPMTKHIAADAIPYWGRSVKKIYFQYATPEYWYYDACLSAAERLKFGVTTGMNVIANEPRIDSVSHVEHHIRGYVEVGVRTIAAVGPGSNDWPKKMRAVDKNGALHDTMATWEQYMENTEQMLQKYERPENRMVRIFVTPFTIVPSIPTWGRTIPEIATVLTAFDKKQLRAVKMLAHKYHTGIHTDAFGNGIEMMAQSDDALLGENVLLQHCYDLNYREIELIAKTKTNIGHSPEQSNHYCPYSELLACGANAIITSDGNGPRVNFDMFEHMRRCQDLEILRFQDFHCLTAQTLLDGVTIGAAKALGMQNEIGSLEVGKYADVLVMKKLRCPLTLKNTVENCVYEMSGRDVKYVFANGVLCVDNGVLTKIDESKMLKQADEFAQNVFREAGVKQYIAQTPVFGNPYQTFIGREMN